MTISNFKTKLKNLFSRKFLVAVCGVATGIVTIIQGETVPGAALIITSILGYCIVEGMIDAKSAAAAITTAASVTTAVSKTTANTVDDAAAEVLTEASTNLNAAVTTAEAGDTEDNTVTDAAQTAVESTP